MHGSNNRCCYDSTPHKCMLVALLFCRHVHQEPPYHLATLAWLNGRVCISWVCRCV
jgi:hypothetical protein